MNDSLVKENCRFVTSIIQEGLTRNFTGKLVAGENSTWSEKRAPNAAKEIFKGFEDQLEQEKAETPKRFEDQPEQGKAETLKGREDEDEAEQEKAETLKGFEDEAEQEEAETL